MTLRDQLADALARLAAVSRQEDWHIGEAEGMTPTQADILRLLMARPAGVRLSFVAAYLQVAQPTASDAVKALERKGFVEKAPDPEDGRAAVLRATRSGTALAARWPMSFGAVVDAVSVEDRATMLAIVSKAILKLERAGKITPQRMCLNCRYFSKNARPGADKPFHCGLIGAAIGTANLRIDCPEHEAA